MNQNQIKLYCDTIRELRAYIGRPHKVLSEVWMRIYYTIEQDDSETTLPVFLALIHPDFYYDRLGRDCRLNLSIPHPRTRERMPRNVKQNRCRLDVLIGEKCPLQRVGQETVCDHLWPYSLGGPSILDNQLELCDECNRQKSNSPYLFPGNAIPNWLNDRIRDLVEQKR